MVRVLWAGPYTVYVFAEQGGQHHKPHCHVYWADGKASVSIPSLRVFAGNPLSRQLRELLEQNLGKLKAGWNQMNPDRTIR